MANLKSHYSLFLKAEDLADGPLTATILAVSDGQFGDVLELDDGSKLTLNQSNGRKLGKAFGYQSEDWIKKSIKLSAGVTKFKDREKGEDKEVATIILEVMSPPIAENHRTLPLAKRDPLDDSDAPF
jgi:hypothetical protein